MWTRVLTAVVVATLIPATGTAGQEPAAERPVPAERSGIFDVVVEVAGLTCPFCAYGLEKKFVEEPAIDSVAVGLEEGEVRLWLKPDLTLPDEGLRRIVRDAGFTPGEIRRPEPPDGDGARHREARSG